MWIKDGVEFHNPLIWQDKQIYNPTPEQLIAAGYQQITPAVPVPKEVSVFTKRQIRLACRELGYETKLDTILNASETYKRDWNEAQDIDFGNEQTQTAIEQAIVAELFERSEIEALLTKLREKYPHGRTDEV